MGYSDTAEYWRDVKRSIMPKEMVYHDPGFLCDNPKREHHQMAKNIEDVNCYRCLRNIKKKGTQLKPWTMKDTDLMPWGKHKGTPIGDVPADYLIWLLDNDKCSGDVKEYIKNNYAALQMQAQNDKKGIK